MKKIALIVIAGLATLQYGNAQLNVENPEAKESIEWKNKVVDMGEIPQKIPATAIFEFTNTGEKPVLITNVKPSCGCTNPQYPKEPIQPGQTAQISAVYNAAALGSFNKSVTVTLNIPDGTHILRLQGKVVEPKDP